jgi:hypothetical protein
VVPDPGGNGQHVNLKTHVVAFGQRGVVSFNGVTAGPQVRVLNSKTFAPAFDLTPFPGWKGDVHVAVGDVTGDGRAEVITAPGYGGAPLVAIHDSLFGGRLQGLRPPLPFGPPVDGVFAAYAEFTGGVSVAIGDVDGDGVGEIVTAPGQGGGPHVRVLGIVDNKDGTYKLADRGSFMAYDANFRGGVSVAVADCTGDGVGDIVTGALNGPAHVRVFDGKTRQEVRGFYAYDLTFQGGVYVAAADLDGDGKAEVITGAAVGGGPHVKVFKDIAAVATAFDGAPYQVVRTADFFADDPNLRGGVQVAVRDLDGDGQSELVTAAGGAAVDRVRVFDPSPLGAPIVEPVNRPPGPFAAVNGQSFGGALQENALVFVGSRDLYPGFRNVLLGIDPFPAATDPDGDPAAFAGHAILDSLTRVQPIRAIHEGPGSFNYRIDLPPTRDVPATLTTYGFLNLPEPSTPSFPALLGSFGANPNSDVIGVAIAPGDLRPAFALLSQDDRGGSSFFAFRLTAEEVKVTDGQVDSFRPSINEVMTSIAKIEVVGDRPGPANLVPTRALTAPVREAEGSFLDLGVVVNGLYVG